LLAPPPLPKGNLPPPLPKGKETCFGKAPVDDVLHIRGCRIEDPGYQQSCGFGVDFGGVGKSRFLTIWSPGQAREIAKYANAVLLLLVVGAVGGGEKKS
jgi:hypothetical protein